MKFHTISEQYFLFAKKSLKIRTYLHYILLYDKHIKPFLGDKHIECISSDEIEDFINGKKRLSCSTLKLLATILKNIKTFAIKQLNISLSFEIKLNLKSRKTKIQALSKSEQYRLERYIISGKHHYHYGIIIALYTGVRIGELLALTWQDVDFKKKTIYVNKTICSVILNNKFNVIINTPKTEHSERIVPLPQLVVPLLKELQQKQKRKCKYVISSATINKPILVRVYQQSFQNLLKKLKIRHYGFHSLRHTFATRAIECGVDAKSLSELLGHSNVNITLNRYVHSSLEQKKRFVNKVAQNLRLYKN